MGTRGRARAQGEPTFLSPRSEGWEPQVSAGCGQAEGGASGGRGCTRGVAARGAWLGRHPRGHKKRKEACGALRALKYQSAGEPSLGVYAARSPRRGVCLVSPPTLPGAPSPCVPLRGSAPRSVWYPFGPSRWRGACALVEAGWGRRPPGATAQLWARHGRARDARLALVCLRGRPPGAPGTPRSRSTGQVRAARGRRARRSAVSGERSAVATHQDERGTAYSPQMGPATDSEPQPEHRPWTPGKGTFPPSVGA